MGRDTSFLTTPWNASMQSKGVIKASRDLAWPYVTFQELKYGAKSNTRSSFNTVQSLNVPSAH